MLKRLGVATAMAAIAVFTLSSAVPATGHGTGHGRHMIRVLSTNTEEAFVDVGEPDFSLGDTFTFTSDLTKHGKTVGHTGVTCTVTSLATGESHCVGAAQLWNGQITVQGIVPGEPDLFKLAITGGTGAYGGAGGTLVVKEVGTEPTQELLTFYLMH